MPIICKVCDIGELKSRTRYRLSGIVAFIGYLILIPSFIGMAIGFFMMFATGAAVSQPATIPNLSPQTEKTLSDKGVPSDVIALIKAGKPSASADISTLSTEQQGAVRAAFIQAQAHAAGEAIGKGAASAVGFGAGLFLILSSLVGGLLGWILTMKKRILACGSCGAVVNAS